MQRHLFTAMLLSSVLLIPQCTSVLSDVEITDPSVLRVSIQLDSHTGISAYVQDKKSNYVALKNGGIYVNDSAMKLENILGPAYFAPQINFNIDSLYTFTVMLADSSKHYFSIRTQKKNIYSFTGPDSISRNDSLVVSWLEKDTTGEMTIKYGSTNEYFGTISISNPASGSYTFPRGFFADTSYHGIYLTLYSIKSGVIDTTFMNGSTINSTISISKTIKLGN